MDLLKIEGDDLAVVIHTAIKTTLKKAIGYCMADKIESENELISKYGEDYKNEISGFRSDNKLINEYGFENDKTLICKTLTTSLNCCADDLDKLVADWESSKSAFNKTGKSKINLAHVFKQSFNDRITPEMAHEIGVKFAERFLPNYEVVVCTHCNTGSVHNHIIFNSVSLEGIMYNPCTTTYREARRVSDKLCDEYGLHVLEKTREQKFVTYKDEMGKTRRFEPTERKEKGGRTYQNANDYRNAPTHINYLPSIKADIDYMIPRSKDIDDFVQRMEKELLYKIKYRTKDGGFRQHFSFRPPMAGKAFRVDDDFNYTTQRLIERIAEAERERKEKLQNIQSANFSNEDIYVYGRIDIDSINANYRKIEKENGEYDYIPRCEMERNLCIDIKRCDAELKKERDKKQKESREQRRERIQQYYLDRIRKSLQVLNLLETHNHSNMKDVKERLERLEQQKQSTQENIKNIRERIAVGNKVIDICNKFRAVQQRINDNAENSDYVIMEQPHDIKQLEKFLTILNKAGIKDVDDMEKYETVIAELSGRTDVLEKTLSAYDKEIERYKLAVNVLDDIGGDDKYKSADQREMEQALKDEAYEDYDED